MKPVLLAAILALFVFLYTLTMIALLRRISKKPTNHHTR
jgi:hypothetical protein